MPIAMMQTILLLGVAFCAQASPEDRFLRALGEKRLDALLDLYCREQIGESAGADVNPALAVELSRSLAIRAAEEGDDLRREELWKESDAVLRQAIDRGTGLVLRSQLALQRATLALAQGDWLAEWDISRGLVTASAAARVRHTEAVQLARLLDESLAPHLARPDADLRTSDEREQMRQLREISRRTTLVWARAALALANSSEISALPPELSLAEVKTRLQTIALARDEGETAIEASLLLARVDERLGATKEAWQTIGMLKGRNLPPELADQVLLREIDLLLAENRVVEALAAVHERRAKLGKIEPEWEYQYLKVLLHQADQMPGDPGAVGKLQASALRQLRILDTLPDPVWRRRGEILLSQHAQSLLLQSSAEYRQAGEILTRAGDHAEAARIYRDAGEQAARNGDGETAIALYEECARSWERGGEPARARDMFTLAAETWPDHPLAPEALLRAILNARRVYIGDSQPKSYAELHRLIRIHLERYPDDETSRDVIYLRGTLRKAEGDYESAIEDFLAVPSEHRLFLASRMRASRVYEAWKRPLDPAGPRDGTLGRVVAFHESLLSTMAADELPWSPSQRCELTLRLCQFLVDERIDQPDQAEARINELLAAPDVPHEWIESARRLLLLALVRQGKYLEAEQLADVHARAPAADVLATLQLLHDQADRIGDLEKKYIGRVEAHLVRHARTQVDRWEESHRRDWELALARIELNLGNDERLAESIARLQEIRSRQPRDLATAELLGLCLMRLQRHESAILIWKELMDGLPEASAPWYRAKLNLITCLRRSGNIQDARQVLKLLEILHPDLGGSPIRERFLAEREQLIADT